MSTSVAIKIASTINCHGCFGLFKFYEFGRRAARRPPHAATTSFNIGISKLRPGDQQHSSDTERQARFTLEIPKKVFDPKRDDQVPIDERRSADRKIPVKPKGKTHDRNDPAKDDPFAHGLADCMNGLRHVPELLDKRHPI
jgi:hypothetical protein